MRPHIPDLPISRHQEIATENRRLQTRQNQAHPLDKEDWCLMQIESMPSIKSFTFNRSIASCLGCVSEGMPFLYTQLSIIMWDLDC